MECGGAVLKRLEVKGFGFRSTEEAGQRGTLTPKGGRKLHRKGKGEKAPGKDGKGVAPTDKGQNGEERGKRGETLPTDLPQEKAAENGKKRQGEEDAPEKWRTGCQPFGMD